METDKARAGNWQPKTLTPEFEAYLDRVRREEVSVSSKWVKFVIEQVRNRLPQLN